MLFRNYNFYAMLLMVLTTLAHAFAGGPAIWDPVFESSLSVEVRITMGLVWHGLTVLFAVMAILNWIAMKNEQMHQGINLSMTLINLGLGLLALIYGYYAVGNLWLLPQWILFLPSALLNYLALKQN